MRLFTRRLIATSLLSLTLLCTMAQGQSSIKRPLIDKGLEEVIYGYDAVLIIPEVHAATLY
jgi:hypothetical protein